MAKIVFGAGVSHSPLLGSPPTDWTTKYRAGDQKNPLLWFRGRRYTYDELVELRAEERLDRYLTEAETTKRYNAAREALGRLMDAYHAAAPDVLVLIGNDHAEVFKEMTPAFGVYTASELHNVEDEAPLFIAGAYAPRYLNAPPERAIHRGLPDMALHVVEALKQDNFDLTVISESPRQGVGGGQIMPHAYGFVYHHLLNDAPPPSLPIHINTFFPPNQPTMARVLEFSDSLGRAIESWGSDERVAIVASGGLSHFIVDEQFDNLVIDAIRTDVRKLAAVDETFYQSGSSEAKNWVPVAATMQRLGVPLTNLDYIPCYRSPAGNGHGMTFAYWTV